METEIDDFLYKRYRIVEKYDISEKNESDFIYKKSNPTILEDSTLKDKNKVKSTLYRLIFTNQESESKYFRATIKKRDLSNILRINCFLPQYIFDKIESHDMTNFYNIVRIRSDLPFLKRDDASISIDFKDDIQL